MKILGKILLTVLLMTTVASAALLTEYMRDERTIEVRPWMTFEFDYDPQETVYGDTTIHDFINVTSHKKYSTTCEIDTEIYFNGEILEDTEGIHVSYSVESGSGALVTPSDHNNNGMPEAAVFGTQDVDGIFTIRRNIGMSEDLEPGAYKIITILIPFQGN